jgi:hypothetical protein
MARRDRAAAKAARRDERKNAASEDTTDQQPAEQDAVLAELAALHARFDAGELEFEAFEAARQELTERLHIS